jgi:hypothetical protein
MSLKSTAVKTGIAAIALTALGLVAAAPASAHTNNMYTHVNYDNQSEQAGFATYGKTDGVVTPLPTTFVPVPGQLVGIEVSGEKGTAIGSGTEDENFVMQWNHTTGERGVKVAAFVTDAEFSDFSGLDTLNDGTTVTLLDYFDSEDELLAVASVNAGTGEIVPLVDLTDVLTDEGEIIFNPTSLATDPATGITYVFLFDNDGNPHFLAVDVAGNTVGEPVPFEGAYFVQGIIFGADFDAADGSLYFNYQNSDHQQYELTRIGAPSTWPTADPSYISSAPSPDQYGDVSIDFLALTIEHTALAATGSELPIFAIVLVGTVAVLAGGVTVMVARRRSDAGVV